MNKHRSNALSNLFDDVYDELDTNGWTRGIGSHSGGTDPSCLLHALARVCMRTKREHLYPAAIRLLAAHVGGDEPTFVACVVRWNDRQTSSYPALRVLEALADLYRRP